MTKRYLIGVAGWMKGGKKGPRQEKARKGNSIMGGTRLREDGRMLGIGLDE